VTATVYTPIESAEDLRARIREVGATEPDPVRITDLVLQSLSRPEEFRAIAAEALLAYVHHELAMADVERPASVGDPLGRVPVGVGVDPTVGAAVEGVWSSDGRPIAAGSGTTPSGLPRRRRTASWISS
jgi:hypothetical protein